MTLATLHSAKGLEWESRLHRRSGGGPAADHYAKLPESIDEERRLFYVGITRAKRKLQLSWAADGSHRGQARQASRFLAELGQ